MDTNSQFDQFYPIKSRKQNCLPKVKTQGLTTMAEQRCWQIFPPKNHHTTVKTTTSNIWERQIKF